MIDISRRRRIAAGAGVDPSDVVGPGQAVRRDGRLVKQMAPMTMLDKIRAMSGLGRAGAFNPGASSSRPSRRPAKASPPRNARRLRKEREKEERKRRREERNQG